MSYFFYLFPGLGIVISWVVGDQLTDFRSPYFLSNRLLRCLCDSLVHAIIGATIWVIVKFPVEKGEFLHFFAELCLAGFLSSVIDVDHFIEGRSLSLENAVSLARRPLLHNTSLILVIFIALMFTSRTSTSVFYRTFPLMFLTSCFSHHIRDGFRRGLWIFPFETVPLSISLCAILLTALSIFTKILYRYQKLPCNYLIKIDSHLEV